MSTEGSGMEAAVSRVFLISWSWGIVSFGTGNV